MLALSDQGAAFIWGALKPHSIAVSYDSGTSVCLSDIRHDIQIDFGTYPKQIQIPEKIISIAAGTNHAILVTEFGILGNCWNCLGILITRGLGEFYYIGVRFDCDILEPIEDRLIRDWKLMKITNAKIVQAACGDRHTILLDSEGNVWTFGQNALVETGHPCNPESSPCRGLLLR